MKTGPSRTLFLEIAVFSMAFTLCLFLATRLNFEKGKPTGRGVFYSDKSIYYVYLPATFIYGWDAAKFPSQCDTLYRGFILDTVRGKVIAKMTYGVALMWTPFFLATHSIALIFNLKPDGFSDFYQHAALIPPVFFLIAGLFFLRRFLVYYFPPGITWLTILLVFAGTNLCYYGLAEGLMSHVHSFFLFSLYLYLLKKWLDAGMNSFRIFITIGFLFALITLVRPTNVVMILCLFLLDVKNVKELLHRLRMLAKPGYLIALFLTGFLVFLPQFIYWKYAWGSFIHYSYGGEGFTNWQNPAIVPVLFSPLNGLIPYSPIVLFMLAGIIIMIYQKINNGILLLLLFALVTWITGSWHMWYFGGSYGSRPYVEYYAILSPGLGYLLTRLKLVKNWFAISLIALTFLVFIWYNQRLIRYNYWNTSSVWAWDDFKTRLGIAGVIHLPREKYTYINDFENISFEPALVPVKFQSHSMFTSALFDSRYSGCTLYDSPMTDILDQEVQEVFVSLWTRPVYGSFSAQLVAEITDDQGHVWVTKKTCLKGNLSDENGWSETSFSFPVPGWLTNPEYRLKLRIENSGRRTFYLDDVRVEVR